MEVGGKYKLLMIRTKYLKNALELSKEIFQKAYVSFMSELDHKVNSSKRPTEKNKKKSQENKQASSDVSTEQRVESEPDIEAQKDLKDENLKQVFKEIAKQIHPDKLGGLPDFEKKYKETLFNKARMALQENDYYAIVEVAEQIGIEPPEPTQEQIEIMKKTNNRLEIEISKIEESLVWTWYHSDEDKKKTLMEKYIGYLEKQCARA